MLVDWIESTDRNFEAISKKYVLSEISGKSDIIG